MNLKISDIPRYGSVRSTKHKIKAELLKDESDKSPRKGRHNSCFSGIHL